MKESYDVVVVGGGIAGLTSAAYLGRAGKNTLLVEKQEKLGGLVSTFWHEDFAFDAGARACRVVVPDFQLSLAIGKEGQNARLAARLTGYKIDIKPASYTEG